MKAPPQVFPFGNTYSCPVFSNHWGYKYSLMGKLEGYAPKWGVWGDPPHVSSMGGGWDMKNARRGKVQRAVPPPTPQDGGTPSLKFSRKGILLGCAAKRRLRRGESDFF